MYIEADLFYFLKTGLMAGNWGSLNGLDCLPPLYQDDGCTVFYMGTGD